MLELFVITICLKTTAPACEYSASSYYTQSGIEDHVSKKSQYYTSKHPILASVVGYAAAISQEKVTIPLTTSNSLTLDTKQHTISYKYGF